MSEVFEKGESGFEFVDEDTILTPVQTERFLKQLHNEIGRAQLELRKARREEAEKFRLYLTARKPFEVEPDCPEVGRGVGQVTEKARELWFEARIPKQYWAWKEAVLIRQNAADYVWQVKKQTEIMQSINANNRLMYTTFPGGGR